MQTWLLIRAPEGTHPCHEGHAIESYRLIHSMQSVEQIEKRVGGDEFAKRGIVVDGDLPCAHDIPQEVSLHPGYALYFGEFEERARRQRAEHQSEPR